MKKLQTILLYAAITSLKVITRPEALELKNVQIIYTDALNRDSFVETDDYGKEKSIPNYNTPTDTGCK